MLTKTLTGVDFRANNIETLDNLEKNSLDFYASVKSQKFIFIKIDKEKIANKNQVQLLKFYMKVIGKK